MERTTPSPLLAGRDVRLPRWLGRPPAPRYDSIVICGNGIGGLCVAARLAQSDAFAGRVVLAAPPIVESRRLIGGVTLRARAVDYYALALECQPDDVVFALYGEGAARAETHVLRGGLAEDRPDGALSLPKTAQFLDRARYGNRPLAYGARNSHVAATLRRLMDGLDFVEHPGLPESVDEARALATGKRPLVINATPRPLGAAVRPKPTRFVAASQITFTSDGRERAGVLSPQSSFVAMHRAPHRLAGSVYFPLVDPRSPRATHYGIFFSVVPADVDRERELALLRAEVTGVGAALGLEPHDVDETRGEAVVPCTSWKQPNVLRDDVFDFYAAYNTGVPIVTGDGMTRAGLAAVLAAEAILAGEDPSATLRRGLSVWRALNRAFATGLTTISRITEIGVRHAPGFTLGRVADFEDTWAGIGPAALQ